MTIGGHSGLWHQHLECSGRVTKHYIRTNPLTMTHTAFSSYLNQLLSFFFIILPPIHPLWTPSWRAKNTYAVTPHHRRHPWLPCQQLCLLGDKSLWRQGEMAIKKEALPPTRPNTHTHTHTPVKVGGKSLQNLVIKMWFSLVPLFLTDTDTHLSMVQGKAHQTTSLLGLQQHHTHYVTLHNATPLSLPTSRRDIAGVALMGAV